jgi:ADP-ribosylglycohydrolase
MSEAMDKAYGCLAGLALGDAMGMPVEFMTPARIAEEYGWIDGLVASPSWHPHRVFPPGTVTDDTGQALALADVYRSQGAMTAEGAAAALMAWAGRCKGRLHLILGPSTSRSLAALQEGADPTQSGRSGKTNGAAMRVAPVGIVRAGNPEATLADTVQACLPTHGTTLAISGAAAVAFAIAEAMHTASTLDSIIEAATDGAVRGREHGAWAWTPPLERRIRFAVQLALSSENERAALQALYDLVGVDLLITESIATAFGLVALAAGDPMRAIRHAVNLGGDTDTVGAIAGAICGAWRGATAVDANLLAQVERINHLDLRGTAQDLVLVGEETE